MTQIIESMIDSWLPLACAFPDRPFAVSHALPTDDMAPAHPRDMDMKRSITRGSVKPVTPRGIATRERLKEALIEALNGVAFDGLRVTDVTQRAGVAVGLFYRYFPDLMTAIKEVSDDLLTRFGRLVDVNYPQGPEALFERIRVYETVVVRNFVEFPGLMRATRALGAIDKEHSARAVTLFELHLEFIVTGVKRPKRSISPTRKSELLMRAEALAGMGSACLWARYVEKQRNLRYWQLTQDETVEWLSILFYRGLTGSQPDPGWLRHREKMTALLAWPFET